MKNIVSILALLLVLAAACSDDDDDETSFDKANLLGSWLRTSTTIAGACEEETDTFSSNQLTIDFVCNGMEVQETFQYTFDGKAVTLTGEGISATVITLTSTSMVLDMYDQGTKAGRATYDKL